MIRSWDQNRLKFLRQWLALAAIVLLQAACNGSGDTDPAILRVSVLPDQKAENVRAQHGPLVDYVCERAGLECQWIESHSYTDLVARFGRKEVDLAFFGGVTFVQAANDHGAEPLVMRDVDALFSSGFFVRADDKARSLEDLAGYSFAFGAESSTSGHYMPRHFLQRAGIQPETFFESIVHSAGHDDTLDLISRGEVDSGVVNMQIARQIMQQDGLRFRLVWESPPYTDYVWAVQPGLSEGLRLGLRDAFLSLRRNNPRHLKILELQGAGGFLPASNEDFAELRAILLETRGQLSGRKGS